MLCAPCDACPSHRNELQAPIRVTFMEAVKGAKKALRLAGVPGMRAESALDVEIPAGVAPGDQIELQVPIETADRAGRRQAGRARVVLNVEVEPHPLFRREGNDIHIKHDLRLSEALLGCRASVPTIDGRAELAVPQCTQNGDKLRMRGKGVPNPRRATVGDQIVEIRVVAPRSLTDRQKELLRQFEAEEEAKGSGGGSRGSGNKSWWS